MINWLKSLWNNSFGAINDLYHYVLGLFQAVYSYVDSYVQQIWNTLVQTWNFASWVYNTLLGYVGQLFTLAQYYLGVAIRDVEAWISSLVSQIYSVINGVINWVNGLISTIEAWIGQELQSLANWVLRNIWDPLYNYISGAVNWIEKYGYWVYYILTHPDELARILGRYILGSFFSLGRQYSGLAARWIVHSMISAGSEVADVIERAIVAIL